MQRNKQVAMGRKKFNMDPKKVGVFNSSIMICLMFFQGGYNLGPGFCFRGSSSSSKMTC